MTNEEREKRLENEIVDLIKQATEEHSHYYVKSVLLECLAELRAALSREKIMREALEFYAKGKHAASEPKCYCQQLGVRQRDLEQNHVCNFEYIDDPGEDGSVAREALERVK